MSLVLCVATMRQPSWLDCIASWYRYASPANLPLCVIVGKEVLPAYQECYERTREPILGFIHDDLEISELNWDERVMREFEDPAVGMVGIAGGLGHGSPNLYKVPYHLPNLARQQFVSNLREAEQHGRRFSGECDVAVLDAMAVFVRRSVLDPLDGFEHAKPYGYWLWCEWLCCSIRRMGLRIRMVGLDAHHLGGRTSTAAQIKDNYEEAHRLLFENNRDVLPALVRG